MFDENFYALGTYFNVPVPIFVIYLILSYHYYQTRESIHDQQTFLMNHNLKP